MAATKPVIHGRDHLPSGADPIFPTLPTGRYDEIILADPDLLAYWPLDDASGDALDHGPHGYDLAPRGSPVYGQPGPFPDSPELTSVEFDGVSADFRRGDAAPLPATDGFTVECWVYTLDWPDPYWAGIFEGLPGVPGGSDGRFSLQVRAAGNVLWTPGSSSSGAVDTDPVSLNVGQWVHIVATCHLTDESVVYFNGEPVATSGSYGPAGVPSAFPPLRTSVGSSETLIASQFFTGRICQVAVYGRAFTAGEAARDYQTGIEGGDSEGDVLTVGPDGVLTWAPPTVEVTGGGVNPAPVDETPADSSHPAGSGPTTSTGWHLDAHVETVVLHDPNPGRFDVPTMKWVRVPFTSITIYRTWEPTVDAEVLKTARLKDDRGLMQAAKNGILHINPDMAWPDAPPMNVWIDDSIVSHPEHHLVEGWFSIEYPVLDARYLPENDVELGTLGPTPDAPRPGVDVLVADGYQRAARFMNVSTGSVLRFHAGSTDRSIINWWFWGTANDSTGDGDGPGTGNADNPLPIWGDWPARPIHMTPPYPQMSPTDSKAYYKDYQGMAGNGFGPFRGLTAGTNLAAGANLCMQAWQDSPWLLRFSTGRFPAYRGFDQDYNGFPHLAVTYHYDPDTIDHTTGKLLLPAT